jgi:hypothetical protein
VSSNQEVGYSVWNFGVMNFMPRENVPEDSALREVPISFELTPADNSFTGILMHYVRKWGDSRAASISKNTSESLCLRTSK